MADFENQELGVRFTVPDRITVRQQLLYMGTLATREGDDILVRQWAAARTLIQDWHSEMFPDPAADLDSVEDRRIAKTLIWAGRTVLDHVIGLDAIPKARSRSSSRSQKAKT